MPEIASGVGSLLSGLLPVVIVVALILVVLLSLVTLIKRQYIKIPRTRR